MWCVVVPVLAVMPCTSHGRSPPPLRQSWGMRRLLSLKDPLRPILLKACKFIKRSDVNQALVYLGLLKEEDLVGLLEDEGKGGGAGEEANGDKQEGLEHQPAAQVGYWWCVGGATADLPQPLPLSHRLVQS